MCSPKLIIISETGYRKKHDAFLKTQIKEGCELFCVTGKDSKTWQAAINKLIKQAKLSIPITCIQKNGQPLQELTHFAQQFKTLNTPDTEADIIYL